MANSNHYTTLDVSPTASQAEIKQAYRRLAKLFHPDSNHEIGNHERITHINAAYEVLGDPARRSSYDRQLRYGAYSDSVGRGDRPTPNRQQRTAAAQKRHRQGRQTVRDTDEQLNLWLNRVYQPVDRTLYQIIFSLQDEIDDLAADPFDDELMEEFVDYIEGCRQRLIKAQESFQSMPNPSTVAGVAARLYYCLNQVGDGLDELERFTFNYSEHYLHTGQELFRIAKGLRREAQAALSEMK